MATRGVNKVILLGNIGQEPTSKQFQNGMTASISLATSETWKDKASGKAEERTEWHKVVFYGKIAEIASKYLKKGSKVYIEGSLRTRKWDKDGVTHYTTEVIANSMQMLGEKASQPRQSDDGAPYANSSDDFDDDIPF